MHLDRSTTIKTTTQTDRGLALLLVIFIIALASVLVINLTYSTTLGARLNARYVRAVQAEYLLKSVLNFARKMIVSELPGPDGAPQEMWLPFKNGAPLPLELVGVSEPNTRIELEIRPEDSMIRVSQFNVSSNVQRWGPVLYRLFVKLGFDDDDEADQFGQFKGRAFKSEDLVGILIDYQDADKDSFTATSYARGLESELKENVFANSEMKNKNELRSLPGFTAKRLEKLMPYVTDQGSYKININTARSELVQALNQNIDDLMIERLVEERTKEPFNRKGNYQARLQDIFGATIYNEIFSMITVESSRFRVIAKVDYGGQVLYYLRAVVFKQPGVGSGDALPEISSLELF